MEESVISKNSSGDPYQMNGLTLAYIGDAVFELMVREHMIENGFRQANKLHKHTTAAVNAGTQSRMSMAVMDMLNNMELAVYKRGRNSAPMTYAKHQTISDYRRATGLEALFGYLYLKGDEERLKEIFEKCMESIEEEASDAKDAVADQ